MEFGSIIICLYILRFLDNKWIVEVVYGYYLKNDAEGAVERLVKEATEAW